MRLLPVMRFVGDYDRRQAVKRLASCSAVLLPSGDDKYSSPIEHTYYITYYYMILIYYFIITLLFTDNEQYTNIFYNTFFLCPFLNAPQVYTYHDTSYRQRPPTCTSRRDTTIRPCIHYTCVCVQPIVESRLLLCVPRIDRTSNIRETRLYYK